MILYVYAMKSLKIYSKKWHALDVYKVHMGLPVQQKVRKFIDRIVFISVILFLIDYSINFYTEFMEVKLVLGEVPFDTFDEMWKYKLKVYCNTVTYARS
ncbi:hypothetical protein TSAR_005984 [Trichomalopsis sarcophagae]|uniref:Uncharacterized protein n=1 Tax=Trichomalopsis sarcophagae TaxID=543379 RepID=A0A232FE66_9HYME|nr:hypothetical protein TSAR_005984 [Trichomalopsis sarcophagae]